MLKRARFIHVQCKTQRFNGFTVYFFPSEEVSGDVNFTVTRCHKSDQFCKKIAREACYHAEVENTCTVKEFPSRVAMIDHTNTFGLHNDWDKTTAAYKRAASNRYAWLWKYFL